MNPSDRISWIDGLKGISCILIFVHHFCLLFLPAIHFGEGVPSHMSGVDVALSQSPFSFFLNGNFLVALFCTLSGVVISLQVIRLQERERLADVVAKRYFRLVFPLLPVAVAVFVLLRFHAFSHLETAVLTESPWALAYYREPITVTQFLKSAFVDTWFFGSDLLSTAFWMLSDLFYGSFISVVLSVIPWKYPRRAWVLYVILLLFLWNRSELATAFVFGTLLAWISCERSELFHPVVGLIVLLVGVFLGAYPSGVVPTNAYRFLTRVSCIDWHILGAFLTVFGMYSCRCLQRVLSFRVFEWLGRISYAVYLIHIPLLFTLSSALFLGMNGQMGYLPSVILSLLISLVVLVFLAFFYFQFVERGCVKIQGLFFRWLKKIPDRE